MTQTHESTWFEMIDVRKLRFDRQVWIPLRVSETVEKAGVRGQPGSWEDMFCCVSIAVPPDKRKSADALDWNRLSLMDTPGPCVYGDGRYKQCEVFENWEDPVGINLVLEHSYGHAYPSSWDLNQDLVLALGLLKEGNSWVRPSEGFALVARERIDEATSSRRIEIRSEYLKDYLAARCMALRLSMYRQRTETYDYRPNLPWSDDPLENEEDHMRLRAQVFEIDESGGPFGARTAVFTAWRTDVNEAEDVPIFGPESEENTDFESRSFVRAGRKLYEAEGELWWQEWVEPATKSHRVRGDDFDEPFFYLIDNAGTKNSHHDLDSEDIGRYLWFGAEVVQALTEVRGGGLRWYTKETGSIWCSPDYPVHFGANSLGLVTVYAYDIARLPDWQQRIWSGYNRPPDGGVSKELLASQQGTRPAGTKAPEALLPAILADLDNIFLVWTNAPLFRGHKDSEAIMCRVQRFQAVNKAGLYRLAKDAARLVIDRINVDALHGIAKPAKGEKWASIKSLEKALATITDPESARAALTPLVGIYELRLGDAHLPSEDIDQALDMVGIDGATPNVIQGEQLIESAVRCLASVYLVVRRHLYPNEFKGGGE